MPSIIHHAAAALLLAASACAFADVTVEGAWIRGVVAGQSSTGAFMTLRSSEDTELVAVSSPVAEALHVHRTAMVDGMMAMEPVDSLAVPGRGSVALEPGGFHVMLVGLRSSLHTGDKVPLTLTFRAADRRAITVTVQAEVRDVSGTPLPATH